MKVVVVNYPGSNCAADILDVMNELSGSKALLVEACETEVPTGTDLVIIPGGFSFGDYLRSGAMASVSPIAGGIRNFADKGGYILGICNGFQILTEMSLLPGALIRNRSLKFVCRFADLLVCKGNKALDMLISPVINLPVAHHDGCYVASDYELEDLNNNQRIAFRYSDKSGNVNDATNINGSIQNIAGIFSDNGRILGMMPHPERAVAQLRYPNCDGSFLINGVIETVLSS